MRLHIIHLPQRNDRMEILFNELDSQGISEFKIWDGIVDPDKTCRGIAKAHKQIVRYAKENKLPEVLIAEDDLHFTSPGAFDFFLQNKPKDFDLYLGGVSHGKLDPGNQVDDFAGGFFYLVNARFYNEFLNTSEEFHIDRQLRGKGKFIVCDPFAVIEHSGFSDNTKRFYDADLFFLNRDLYHGANPSE
jgi:hypothetical protein